MLYDDIDEFRECLRRDVKALLECRGPEDGYTQQDLDNFLKENGYKAGSSVDEIVAEIERRGSLEAIMSGNILSEEQDEKTRIIDFLGFVKETYGRDIATAVIMMNHQIFPNTAARFWVAVHKAQDFVESEWLRESIKFANARYNSKI